MKKYDFGFSFVPLHAILVVILIGAKTAHCEDTPTISVSGTAEIRVVPDEGVLTFSIESRNEQLDAAVADNDQKIKAVIDFLKQSNVETNDIRTELINIRPVFDDRKVVYPNKPFANQANAPAQIAMPPVRDKEAILKPVGYKARRQLSVSIKKLTDFEAIYRGVLKRGVNEINSMEFKTSELRKYKDQARSQAIIAAREKATALSGELGATLAGVHSIREDNSGFRFANNFQNSSFNAGGASGTMAAGMIEITATISVVFRLGNTDMD